MAAITDFADAVQEQVTGGVKKAQEIHLAAFEVARDFAALFLPARGTLTLPKGLPAPTKVIDQAYDLAGKLLELQHDYAVRVVKAMTPPVAEKS
jgi:hypothetical protein